nr:helix-turn-helix domain-containing protein [uncultured Flavobacterium sp.]
MQEDRTNEIKKLIAEKIKTLKGEIPYSTLANKSNLTAARISDAANNKIDFRISTLIEIATALRVNPKELFDIEFNFDEYYNELENF